MITVDKGFNEQAVTDRITEHSHVSVLLFDNYQTFANFVEILYAYKRKDITLFLCLKSQNCSKSSC